jgi:hypothetical protein
VRGVVYTVIERELCRKLVHLGEIKVENLEPLYQSKNKKWWEV